MVPVTTSAAWAVVCGLALGTGLWMLVSLTPRLSRPRLADRVAPYVLDVSPAARELVARRPANPLPVLGFVFAHGRRHAEPEWRRYPVLALM